MTRNILALGTYAVDTAEGGGKYVIHNLFKRVSSKFNITFLSLVEHNKLQKQEFITKNFENIQIPQNMEQANIQWEKESKIGTSIFDIIQINNWQYNTEYVNHVKKLINLSDIIILEHPYFANLVKSLNTNKPIIYHAHNVELIQKQPILPSDLLNNVKNVELLACEISSQIWVSSDNEKDLFMSTYGIPNSKLKLLPHGTDLNTTKFIDRKNHEQLKSKVKDMSDKTIFAFTGSWHPPNLESLEFIISDLAPLNKNFLFFVIGNIRDYYLHKHSDIDIPKNVILFGSVPDAEKIGLYKLADFAINPMFSGAGTNLKMLEYMALGLPIISTDFGARGIKISNSTLICKKEKFAEYIKNAVHTNYSHSTSIQENYDIVRNLYDYGLISNKCVNFLYELLDPKLTYLEIVFKNVITELNSIGICANDSIVETISKETELIINTS